MTPRPSHRPRAHGAGMELKTAEEVRVATAALASGSGDALDRLVWTGVFGSESARDLARQAVLDQARSAGLSPASIRALYLARARGEAPQHPTAPALNTRS